MTTRQAWEPTDREAAGAFLRHRRESYAVTGGGSAGSRRTPGLRRSEVAERAYISIEHYTNLERGRGSGASRQVLTRVAHALNLSPAETAHLFAVVGYAPHPRSPMDDEVPVSLLRLIHAAPTIASVVMNARYDVLAWNDLAVALFEDFGLRAPDDRNLIRDHFLTHPPDAAARHYYMSGVDDFSRNAVRHLRSILAKYPDDAATVRLHEDLMRGSEEFARLWKRQEVGAHSHAIKVMMHPRLGEVPLALDVLDHPHTDQKVAFFTPHPASVSRKGIGQALAERGTNSTYLNARVHG